MNDVIKKILADGYRRSIEAARRYEGDLLESVKGQLKDPPMFYKIGVFWDCQKSPFGLCAYHRVTDKAHDRCVFCCQPEERK
jgi:hypothetical protein